MAVDLDQLWWEYVVVQQWLVVVLAAALEALLMDLQQGVLSWGYAGPLFKKVQNTI